MAHDMSGAAGILMIIMMLVMGGFSLTFLRRAIPAAWWARIRHAARRPAGVARPASKEGAR
jgi:hypothetical protein